MSETHHPTAHEPAAHGRPDPDGGAGSRAGGALAIRVNGAPRRVPAGTTVEGLVRLLEMEGRRLAVAVNRAVVPRSRHAEVTLAHGDRVEVLEAVGGG